MQNLKNNKKGFTLIEVIVVLIIIAILAAIAVPAMLKYIDQARDRSLYAETRSMYLAAQSVVTSEYGFNKKFTDISTDGVTMNATTQAKMENYLDDELVANGINGAVTKVYVANDTVTGKYKVKEIAYHAAGGTGKWYHFVPGSEVQVSTTEPTPNP